MNRTINDDEMKCDDSGEAPAAADQRRMESASEDAAHESDFEGDTNRNVATKESLVAVEPESRQAERPQESPSCVENSTETDSDTANMTEIIRSGTGTVLAVEESVMTEGDNKLSLEEAKVYNVAVVPATQEGVTSVFHDGRDETAAHDLTPTQGTRVSAVSEGDIEEEGSHQALNDAPKCLEEKSVVEDAQAENKPAETSVVNAAKINKADDVAEEPSLGLVDGCGNDGDEDDKLEYSSNDKRKTVADPGSNKRPVVMKDLHSFLSSVNLGRKKAVSAVKDAEEDGDVVDETQKAVASTESAEQQQEDKATSDEFIADEFASRSETVAAGNDTVDSESTEVDGSEDAISKEDDTCGKNEDVHSDGSSDTDPEPGSKNTSSRRNLSESAVFAMSSLRKKLSDANMSRMNKLRDMEITEERSVDSDSLWDGDETISDTEDRQSVREEEKKEEAKVDGLIPKLLRRETEPDSDVAHEFHEHTYSTPTNCDICSGLLVGLWSQGLQCSLCSLNVHRGEGINDHDDCRAEALLTPCSGCPMKIEQEEEPVKLREAFQQVRQIAKESPTFLRDVRAQMDKDIKSHAKHVVVKKSAEAERSKKLRRLRAKLVPLVESVDAVESWGEAISLLVLLLFHVAIAGVVAFISVIGFLAALWSWHSPLTVNSALRLAMIHDATVLQSLHVVLLILALLLRRATYVFKRKAKLLDQFLRDVVKIEAKDDLGISVDDFATRARSWSNRFVVSASITCVLSFIHWHDRQPQINQMMQ